MAISRCGPPYIFQTYPDDLFLSPHNPRPDRINLSGRFLFERKQGVFSQVILSKFDHNKHKWYNIFTCRSIL
ncbi:hypothetical protein [Flavonifractor sp. An306]|uniref:hypothetical protein n=1 Tax=Flavonifractor sp. An306 TaxID=1965629 RepID=UPI00174B2B79|nr:hypothetical protein [Flavonifractor sp. An306]